MTIKVLQWNARGLIGKWAEAKPMFMQNNYQVICIQETHFMANDKYSFRIPKFSAYHEYSTQGGRGGGVSIFVSDKLPHYRIPLQSTLQAVVCLVRVQNKRIAVCCLYLPPAENFTFQEMAQLINNLPQPFIICTDANSKHYMWGSQQCDSRGNIWMDLINHYALQILNDGQATRVDDFSGTESHIDLTVATSDIAPLLDWDTIKDLHSSDHFPICINIGLTPGMSDIDIPGIFLGWNIRKADWENFKQHCNFKFDDTEGMQNCELITQTIVDAAEKYIPERKSSAKFNCPWWNDECKEALKERRRAQNRMRRNPHSEFLRIEYRRAKAKAQRTVREAKVSSWKDLLSVFNHRTPMNKLWGIIRNFSSKGRTSNSFPVLLINNSVVDDPTEVVNTFGQFFADMSGRSNYSDRFLQRERLIMTTIPDFGDDNTEDYNMAFSIRELTEAINQSGSTSVGPDRLHYDFFKHMNDDQRHELLKYYNYVWTHDLFPQSWRHSYVIPILKPGKDRNQLKSYRPIQLTSCMCKLMERMIAKRFGWCLERYDLLTKYQCAFRKGRCTMDHLVRLESHVRDGFLHHYSTLAVFLDIKSAYNLVSPTILLNRLYLLGFRGHMMHFIESYLSKRTFQVRCGVLSDVFTQEYGLVQGGVLSPLLFNAAIDSLFDNVPNRISYAIYADDCTIWAQGRELPILFNDIQEALNKVGEWSNDNGFTFSAEKSCAVLFRRGLKRVDPGSLPTLHINDESINVADRVKYLGVWLDAKLNLGAHVEYTKARALKRMSILKCVSGKSYGADRTILLRMYKSLIRPILDYATTILDGPGNRMVESLECVQNTGLRIATGTLRTSPVRALQVESNVCPLSVRRKDLTLRYYLKILGDKKHPCHGVVDMNTHEHVYRGLSDKYLRRVSGFPVSYRLSGIFRDFQFVLPGKISTIRGTIPPWLLPNVVSHMLLTTNKRHTTEADICAQFYSMRSEFPGYRLFFTDGSKQDGSTGCAFTVNNAFFSHKLHPCISVFTAELFAIREALLYICRNRVEKSLICSDSQSAIRAISSQNRDHCILVEIAELLYKLSCDDLRCVFMWIPGHSGIAGNVRADYWAK